MAIRVYDGFDNYAAQADLQSCVGALEWNDINTTGDIAFLTGRGGYGQCVGLTGNIYSPVWLGGSFNQNYASGVAGAATICTPGAVGPYVDYMLMDYTANVAQLTARVMTDSGTVLVYSGDPNINDGYILLAATAPNAVNPFIWQKIEFGAVISSSGSFDFHVAGTSVVSASGVNTSPSTNSWFNGFRIRTAQYAGVNSVLIDDFLLTDYTTGPGTYAFAGFAGDWAVRTLRTTANYSVQWTPLANQNWQEVGETQFDGDTSYNYATSVGNADSFTFGSLPTTVSAVGAVAVKGAYRRLDASTQTIVQNIKSGGTSSNGATLTLSQSWAYFWDPFVLDPNTSATWTPSAVDALLAGYTLNS